MIKQYQEIALHNQNEEDYLKNRLKNLKKYTIAEILDGDSSSDEDEPNMKTIFPWF
jgi:hemerythrin superfamily protein